MTVRHLVPPPKCSAHAGILLFRLLFYLFFSFSIYLFITLFIYLSHCKSNSKLVMALVEIEVAQLLFGPVFDTRVCGLGFSTFLIFSYFL